MEKLIVDKLPKNEGLSLSITKHNNIYQGSINLGDKDLYSISSPDYVDILSKLNEFTEALNDIDKFVSFIKDIKDNSIEVK